MDAKKSMQLAIGMIIIALLLTACGGAEVKAGQVKGKLVDGAGKPVQATIFLGEPIGATTVKANANLLANVDSSGTFTFENVSPGKYGLVALVLTKGTTTPLVDKKGQLIVFNLTADKGVDLGTIVLEK